VSIDLEPFLALHLLVMLAVYSFLAVCSYTSAANRMLTVHHKRLCLVGMEPLSALCAFEILQTIEVHLLNGYYKQ
jgi:hypothetical protein